MVTLTLTDVDSKTLKKKRWTIEELINFLYFNNLRKKIDEDNFTEQQINELVNLESNKKLDILIKQKFGGK